MSACLIWALEGVLHDFLNHQNHGISEKIFFILRERNKKKSNVKTMIEHFSFVNFLPPPD